MRSIPILFNCSVSEKNLQALCELLDTLLEKTPIDFQNPGIKALEEIRPRYKKVKFHTANDDDYTYVPYALIHDHGLIPALEEITGIPHTELHKIEYNETQVFIKRHGNYELSNPSCRWSTNDLNNYRLPTPAEIESEIQELKNLRCEMPELNAQMDNNWSALDAQIETLSKNLDIQTIETKYEDGEWTSHEEKLALKTALWLKGQTSAPRSNWKI